MQDVFNYLVSLGQDWRKAEAKADEALMCRTLARLRFWAPEAGSPADLEHIGRTIIRQHLDAALDNGRKRHDLKERADKALKDFVEQAKNHPAS
jgi:hypothetical protein